MTRKVQPQQLTLMLGGLGDANATAFYKTMVAAAEAALNTTAPRSCVKAKGGNSKAIRLFAQLYRMTGNTTYSDRLKAEMDAACHCQNWGGPTFLLTAECVSTESLPVFAYEPWSIHTVDTQSRSAWAWTGPGMRSSLKTRHDTKTA